MKIVKFVVKVVIALAVVAFGGLGWFCTMGAYFDRTEKVISAKKMQETGIKHYKVPYIVVTDEEWDISAKNFIKSIMSGWKWMRKD